MTNSRTTSNLRIAIAAVCLMAAGNAVADCGASATPADTQRAYANGQNHERSGNNESALWAYVAAQEATCEENPAEGPAVKRAAALAGPLGAAAEKAGDFEKAYRIYEAGGHYAAADRALMAHARARPDDPGAFSLAFDVLDDRTIESFYSNNALKLKAAGAYKPDPRHLEELMTMPAKGAERAFKKDASALTEEYMAALVAHVQARKEDPSDMIGNVEALAAAEQSFYKKWGEPLKVSKDALSLAASWGNATPDQAAGERIHTQRKQRLQQLVTMLTQKYADAPELLEAAIDFQFAMNLEDTVTRMKVKSMRTQADKLGDAASGRQRYNLAAKYYEIADRDEKAQAARDKYQQMVAAHMQPQMDQARQQAEQIQKQFSDPQKVKEMQERARAAQEAMQRQQQQNKARNQKSADELESELGL